MNHRNKIILGSISIGIFLSMGTLIFRDWFQQVIVFFAPEGALSIGGGILVMQYADILIVGVMVVAVILVVRFIRGVEIT